ncbi:MAG: hypothetical protein DRO88_09495 [Promethearchaeia archaeon]|nr:MAG: hypothetical protein DRO88_09495 [Candidatus Lokiarchaeia archaeon]
MTNLNEQERFIIEQIKNQGHEGISINYRKLQELCAEKFEGVRLILKKLKEKGLVDYDGMIPGYNDDIKLKE